MDRFENGNLAECLSVKVVRDHSVIRGRYLGLVQRRSWRSIDVPRGSCYRPRKVTLDAMSCTVGATRLSFIALIVSMSRFSEMLIRTIDSLIEQIDRNAQQKSLLRWGLTLIFRFLQIPHPARLFRCRLRVRGSNRSGAVRDSSWAISVFRNSLQLGPYQSNKGSWVNSA